MSSEVFEAYRVTLERDLKQGNATEHTHRPALKALLEGLGGHDVVATNEPKRVACGAPDYILTRGVVPLGHVEAKDVGKNLDAVERDHQLARYRDSLGNLVLTDYFEFRWYVEGELRLRAALPRPRKDGRIVWTADLISPVSQLLHQFIQADLPLKSTPHELATRMAGLGRLIRDLIQQTFRAEDATGDLHGQFEAFRNVLIESLSVDEFADMYAQTLCYGLFAARCHAPDANFTRQQAGSLLPKTNPFLRKLFNSIAGPDLDDRIAWAVDQLAEMLARAKMDRILADFGRRTRREDPVVHFYETFLGAYDQKMREARGVYYTPEPVVGYIVRSVDALLRSAFGMKDGLAHAKKIKLKRPKTIGKGEETYETHRLQILDPATGTGTFLYAVIAKIREHFDGNAGAWPGYVAEHLLPRLFGFELLMAPYAVAHMKLGLELEQSGYDFQSAQRLGVFLTNSLEEAHELTGLPLFTQWLSDESRAAAVVKRDAPVMVVLGNPPYSGASANTGEWIAKLLRGEDTTSRNPTGNYFEVDGRPLGERNPRWLNDDYVKFIRFAQWRIEKTGHGILAFVTNHGYLDNPTFRGMRQSLMQTFDEIYLLDLHGNTKKKEKTPAGGKDENVFDIQQGVAIGIFVRHENTTRTEEHLARVFHADLFGLRKEKYATLDDQAVDSTEWNYLSPSSPNYYFVPEDGELREEYETGWKITDIMPINSVGIATARDALTIHHSAEEVWDTVKDFLERSIDDAREAYKLGNDARDWKVEFAQQDLRKSGPTWERVVPILYRPFDVRHTYYTGNSRGIHCMPRAKVMGNFFDRENLGLVTSRLTKGEDFAHVQMTKHLTEVISLSPKTSNNAFVFPLWIYPDGPELLGDGGRRANFSAGFLAALAFALGNEPSPLPTLAYIYAILNTPSYRVRYGQALRRDYPRIPLPVSKSFFARLSEIGAELIALHTFDQVPPRITKFNVSGTNEVAKPKFAADEGSSTVGRIYINDQQFIEAVPSSVWDFYIGGYRVAEKWLKDRKGRSLSYDDLTYYQEMLAMISRTQALQQKLDAEVTAAGGWPLRA